VSEIAIIDSAIGLELDKQINTAKAYPRSITQFIKDAEELVTLDEQTAESCIYSLERSSQDGNKNHIKGASVRLAEIAAACWGNIHAATRIVENDGKMITAEGVAWDLEKNIKIAKQVKRSILTKNGKTYSQDMQTVTGNAASSIALRNAIFSIIPRSFIDILYKKALNFSITKDKSNPVISHERIINKAKNLIDRFSKMGIDQNKIFNYFSIKSIEQVNINQIEEMIGIGTNINEGHLSLEKAFLISTESNKESVLEEILNKTHSEEKKEPNLSSILEMFESMGISEEKILNYFSFESKEQIGENEINFMVETGKEIASGRLYKEQAFNYVI